ncbi:hypothetical protein BBJ28_00001114 [Nothophytophthora sp. Chile5]|nr:hypothetical protein BBJ28_00001114 [Nothophytophthora sp. Chile5]
MLSLIQECELFVEPRLVFVCKLCVARFSSKALLDFHSRVEHPLSMGEDGDAPTALEREASHLFMHPIYQNAIIGVQLKQQGRSQRSSPLGYAKLEVRCAVCIVRRRSLPPVLWFVWFSRMRRLTVDFPCPDAKQGRDFQFFLIQPFAVLGRMSADWRELYNRLGIRDRKGLAGGQVDCHLGNDSMIDNTHAVISWDAHVGSFVIQCLSSRAPISVNGREVSFSSPPATLRSRNLLQIGASVFHFLLPKATEAGTQRGDRSGHSAARGERIPPAEVRVWMLAAVKKRRAARLAAETLDDLAVVAGEEQMKSAGEAE